LLALGAGVVIAGLSGGLTVGHAMEHRPQPHSAVPH
jgi:hypothetical protein